MPVLPNFLAEIAASTMNSHSIVSVRGQTYLDKMIATTHCRNLTIKHIRVHIDTFEELSESIFSKIYI